jgi:hypothetical protein
MYPSPKSWAGKAKERIVKEVYTLTTGIEIYA